MKRTIRLCFVVGLSLSAAIFALFALPAVYAAPQAAGIFIVDRTDDDASVAAQACTASGNDCSLRGAILKANANSGSTILVFMDTIYTLTIAPTGTNNAASGDLNLTANLTVTAVCFVPPCSNAVIQGSAVWNDRLMRVEGSSRVWLNRLTLRGGRSGNAPGGGIWVTAGSVLSLTNSIVFDNVAMHNGGGINNAGYLFLQSSQVLSNSASNFGGAVSGAPDSRTDATNSAFDSNTAVSGGGFYGYGGSLRLVDSEVMSNTINGGGAGIVIANSGLTMQGSRIISNTARFGYGGGITAGPTATLDILSSQIGGNYTGAWGGGIYMTDTVFAITGSVVFSNVSKIDAGGVLINAHSTGTVVNSTFSGNQAEYSGGGLYVHSTLPATLTNVTIASNLADHADSGGFGGGGIINVANSPIYLLNSIVANNRDNAPFVRSPDCFGPLQSLGYNLIGDTTHCVISGTMTGNLTDVDPLLGPLRDNGGNTLTHALLPGSPAIDTASPIICLIRDQRNILRPYNGNGLEFAWCDIGAYEYNGPVVKRLLLPIVVR